MCSTKQYSNWHLTFVVHKKQHQNLEKKSRQTNSNINIYTPFGLTFEINTFRHPHFQNLKHTHTFQQQLTGVRANKKETPRSQRKTRTFSTKMAIINDINTRYVTRIKIGLFLLPFSRIKDWRCPCVCVYRCENELHTTTNQHVHKVNNTQDLICTHIHVQNIHMYIITYRIM